MYCKKNEKKRLISLGKLSYEDPYYLTLLAFGTPPRFLQHLIDIKSNSFFFTLNGYDIVPFCNKIWYIQNNTLNISYKLKVRVLILQT